MTMKALRSHPRVEHVDDERAIGNSLIVTLKPGWTIDPADEHAGVFGEDTVKAALAQVRAAVRFEAQP